MTKEQLEGVLDPMSGAFLSAHSDNPNGDLSVCKQTLPVFDGRQRYDLVLTPKRAVTVKRTTPTGYGGPAVICGVKFIPIAGYQPDNPGIRLMQQSNEIEVWLIPVRGHQNVRALPDCIADPGGLWLRARDLDPSRHASRQRRALSCRELGARQGLTPRAQIPTYSREQMPKINTPLIRACSVPVAFLGAQDAERTPRFSDGT